MAEKNTNHSVSSSYGSDESGGAFSSCPSSPLFSDSDIGFSSSSGSESSFYSSDNNRQESLGRTLPLEFTDPSLRIKANLAQRRECVNKSSDLSQSTRIENQALKKAFSGSSKSQKNLKKIITSNKGLSSEIRKERKENSGEHSSSSSGSGSISERKRKRSRKSSNLSSHYLLANKDKYSIPGKKLSDSESSQTSSSGLYSSTESLSHSSHRKRKSRRKNRSKRQKRGHSSSSSGDLSSPPRDAEINSTPGDRDTVSREGNMYDPNASSRQVRIARDVNWVNEMEFYDSDDPKEKRESLWVPIISPFWKKLYFLLEPGEDPEILSCWGCDYGDGHSGTIFASHWNRLVDIFIKGIVQRRLITSLAISMYNYFCKHVCATNNSIYHSSFMERYNRGFVGKKADRTNQHKHSPNYSSSSCLSSSSSSLHWSRSPCKRNSEYQEESRDGDSRASSDIERGTLDFQRVLSPSLLHYAENELEEYGSPPKSERKTHPITADKKERFRDMFEKPTMDGEQFSSIWHTESSSVGKNVPWTCYRMICHFIFHNNDPLVRTWKRSMQMGDSIEQHHREDYYRVNKVSGRTKIDDEALKKMVSMIKTEQSILNSKPANMCFANKDRTIKADSAFITAEYRKIISNTKPESFVRRY